MQSRLIRFKDAPAYLAMTRNTFNRLVRPLLTAVPIGKTGVAFDRFDLDRWVDSSKNVIEVTKKLNERKNPWARNVPQVCKKSMEFGVSTKQYSEKDFVKVLAQARSMKQKHF